MKSRTQLPGLLLLAALPLLAPASAVIAQTEMPPPPPRSLGDLPVDDLTTAPLQILRSTTLDARPKKVFSYLSDSKNWPAWFESVASVRLEASGTEKLGQTGTLRHFALHDGGMISDRVVALAEGRHFAWSTTADNPYGLVDHLGVLSLEAYGKSGTVLTWAQYFGHPEAETLAPQIGTVVEGALARFHQRFGGESRGGITHADSLLITQSRTTRASLDKTWDLTAKGFGDVHLWASSISHASLRRPADGSWVGSERTCRVAGFPEIKETLLSFDEAGRSFSYQVLAGLPPFLQRAVNTWTLTPASGGGTVVTMRLELDVAPGTPMPALEKTKTQFLQVLDLAAEELVFYLDTGKPHPRKQQAQQAMAR